MQTCIYRKKYVNGTGNSERNVKNIKNQARSLDLSIYVIKSLIQLVRQSQKIKSAKMPRSFKGKKEHTICFFEKSWKFRKSE
jgi:hypothetical protein